MLTRKELFAIYNQKTGKSLTTFKRLLKYFSLQSPYDNIDIDYYINAFEAGRDERHAEGNIKKSMSLKGRKGVNNGRHFSEEAKKHMSEAQLKRHLNNPIKKTIICEERKPVTDETKAKMREANLGDKNPMYGKHLSEETKNLISKAQKDKIVTDETKAKMSAAQKGRIVTDEMKVHISAAQKQRQQDYINSTKNDITPNKICSTLGLSKTTVNRHIKDMKISPTKTVGNIRCFEKETIDLLKNIQVGSSTSIPEKALVDWVKSIYSGTVLENDRTVLDGKELDIYIPEKHLAIEYDGVYWHCELNKDSNYHYNKTIECEKKGIRLIHYFSTDNEVVIKSIIASGLGVYSQKYMARKLRFAEIPTKVANMFLDKTHLHGSAKCNRAFGLYDKNELVQVVTFGLNRFTRKGPKKTELIRMATKLNCQVLGGFSKLIKDSMIKMNIAEIESFVDRRVYNGSGYNSSGWKVVGESSPAYHYWDSVNDILYNRQAFMKQSCLKIWPECNESMTEHQMCLDHKLYRIFDCGNIKLTFTLEDK